MIKGDDASAVKERGFPGGSDDKESVCKAGSWGLIPGLGRFPGEGNVNPLQDSCLQNPMDRGAWQPTAHRVAELDMTDQLTFTFHVYSTRC